MGRQKPPQGRAKQKQKAQKASSYGSPRAKTGRGGDWSEDDEEDGNIMFRGFGGITSRRPLARDPSIKLRNQGIAFISAGSNAPQEPEQKEPEVNEELIAAIALNDGEEDNDINSYTNETEEMDVDTANNTESVNAQTIQTTAEESLQFVVDTTGDPTMTAASKIAPIQYRASLPDLSDSSEEEIIFKGRGRAVVLDDPIEPVASASKTSHATNNKSSGSTSQPTTATNTKSAAAAPLSIEASVSTLHKDDPFSRATKPSALVDSARENGFQPVSNVPLWRTGAAQNVSQLDAQQKQGGQETIEILQAAMKQARQEKKPAKGNMKELSRRGKRGRKRSNRLLREEELEDTDAEQAAYEDYLENINAQESDVEDEAIVDVATATVGKDDEQDWEDTEMTGGDSSSDIADEDMGEIFQSDDDDGDSDLDTDELEEELARTEQELLAAEDALHDRRIQSKSDEQIARLWAKQIELGIDEDELVIDDGDYGIDGAGDLVAARAGLAEYTAFTAGSGKRSKRRGKGDLSFPDASAMADALDQYGNDGFDIMDFERPSLRPTKKGRKGKLPPELEALSDEELKGDMIEAWDRDRAKKRLKKAEREELRSQGLLGSRAKKGKADLGQKYQQGMTMDQIHAELEVFLDDDGKTTQPFPPMDKDDRKALHTIANAFNLKSKSVGTGKGRYPVLYKTQNTLEYDETMFRRVIRAANRGFLKNQGWSKRDKKAANIPKRSGGGSGVGATGLKHGEMVGAGAKEIGQDNFGHRLMQKMGWSKGMALGKDGEGRLEPVEQMMRIGRAGL